MLVIKKDGSTEEFNQDKIARICEALGLGPSEEKYVVEKVTRKTQEMQKDGRIESAKIRVLVIQTLKEVDKYASKQYSWYRKIN